MEEKAGGGREGKSKISAGDFKESCVKPVLGDNGELGEKVRNGWMSSIRMGWSTAGAIIAPPCALFYSMVDPGEKGMGRGTFCA